MLVGEMALEIRLLAKRGKGLRAIAREIGPVAVLCRSSEHILCSKGDEP